MNSNAPLRIVAVVCAALLAACPRPQQGSIDPLREASEAAASGRGSARERALAGHAAYLLESKPAEAEALWKRALEKKEDVWALYGLSESARRSLDTRGRVLGALRICAVEPQHPLCGVAARLGSESLGESPALDRDLEKAALEALAAGARGDAAFLLRLTAAGARRNRGDDAGAQALFAEAGMVDRALLLGPYSAFHFLEWDQAFAPERGELGGEGPLGPILPRQASAPDGHFALWGEATPADVFYWVSDVVVPADGLYQARAAGKSTFELFVDGVSAFERRDFEAWFPESMVVDVPLTAGRHRLAVKVARGSERGDLWLALSRADGKPAQLVFSAAQGAFEAPPPLFARATSAWGTAAALAEALEPEAGKVLAAFVAARDGLRRDDQGARALADRLAERHPSAALLSLRGEAMLADPSLPRRTATGRARRDFEQALALDANEASVLQRLSAQARTEGRLDEAAERLERARAAASPKSWRVLLTAMKLAEARRMDALGQEAARRALALEPGLCDATKLLYELARRHEAVAEADRRLDELFGCPGHLGRKAEHLRHRGDLPGARALFERLSAQTPLLPGPRQEAARLAATLGAPAEATALWSELSRMWPYSAAFHKRRAESLEQAGDKAGARAAREAALRLDGSDLKLRRAIAAENGTEVLAELAEDGRAWIERYQAAKPPEDAPGVYVLDASAIEAHSDGSFTERTHVVAKVLDQRGVSLLAEVHLPAGAEILSLRTLKSDGRVLEPEAIGGKDGISLPGVEVGDFVEWEYLVAHGSRGPAVPGFAAPKFYFRIADGQLFHSSYKVRAPAGTRLEVDAHGMDAPQPESDGTWAQVKVERDSVPLFAREPNMVAMDEVVPFVQVGAGAGNAELLTGFGDYLLERSRPNAEVIRFAREAAKGLTGRPAVEALYAAVMKQIKGPEASLTARATSTLAEERGSRLSLMKSALGALGIPARIVLINPFQADPASYRFPAAERYGHVALLVELPEGELFLEPAVRFAPFGELSPQARDREAAVLPLPGEKARFIRTPKSELPEGKRVALALALDAQGLLQGSGEEVYQGFSAAYLKASLERLNDARRRQAVESSIARLFENAALTDLAIEEIDEPGAPLVVRYRFSAPGFARQDGERLVIPRGVYPFDIARRFLALAERQTPLLVSAPEHLELSVRLKLPAGMALAGAPQSGEIDSPFGRYRRLERLEPGLLAIDEKLDLPLARIPPDQYRAFGELLATIDRIQASERILQRGEVLAPAATPQ